MYNYHQTHFITSAPNLSYLPPDSGIEIVFVGYSNVGKSSALNTLTNQKKLARASKIPGHTRLINLFEVRPGVRLVDLPGYGFAQVSEKLKYKWLNMLIEYLQKRNSLKGLVVLMDIRHPMKDIDQQILQWTIKVSIPVIVLLTKSDKLTITARKVQLARVRDVVQSFMGDIQVETFSSLKRFGVTQLKLKLNTWFN